MASAARPRSIVIIGAGIVGVSAGYFLAGTGHAVTILDAIGPAGGPTGASDGAVSVASKSPGPMMQLAIAGVGIYRQLSQSGVLADEFVTRPTFIVAVNEAEETILARHAATLEAAGIGVTRLTRANIASRVPALAADAVAVLEVHDEGHAIGYRVVHRLAAVGRLTIVRGARVTGLHRDGSSGAVTGVLVGERAYDADAVIIAAGVASAELAELGDVLRPRKGQLIVTDRRPRGSPAMPGSLMSSRYLVSKGVQPSAQPVSGRTFGLVVDPLQTGQLLIGGTREDSGDACETDVEAVQRLLSEAVQLCPSVAGLRVLRVFAGVRAASADGLPLVGALPGVENCWIAAGFEGDGICLGPLIGRTLAQLVAGETPSVDVSMLDPRRLAAPAPVRR